MSFDLEPKNATCSEETINQSVWPPIWRWLCEKYNETHLSPIPESLIRGGQFNDHNFIDALIAERMAEILEKTPPVDRPDRIHLLLTEYGRCLKDGTRAERLIRFFRSSGGFTIG